MCTVVGRDRFSPYQIAECNVWIYSARHTSFVASIARVKQLFLVSFLNS